MSEVTRPSRHETPELGTRRIVAALVGLFALVALALGLAAMLLDLSLGRVANPQVTVPDLPAPRLQISADADLAALRERDRSRLHEGAAVPIERAMEMVTQRGPRAYTPWIEPSSDSGRPP